MIKQSENVTRRNVNSKEILNGLCAGLCIIDKSMKIRWANSQYERWFGSLKDDKDKHCYEVSQGKNSICSRCPIVKTLKDGKVHRAEKSVVGRNKEKKYYLVIATPIKENNKVIQALELIQDITYSKKEERHKNSLICKFKSICRNLFEANKKLKSSISSLRRTNKHTTKLNELLHQKHSDIVSKLKLAKEEIQDITQINKSLSSSSDLQATLDIIVKSSRKITGANAACLSLIKPLEDGLLLSDASSGLSRSFLENSPIKLGEGTAGIAVTTKKPIIITNIKNDPRVKYPKLVQREGILSLACVPAIFNEEVLGVISVYFKYPKIITKEEINLLIAFASQAALAIQETRLYQDVHINYFNTIHTLVLAMEARDPYTMRHSERVTQYSIKIAKNLGLSDKQIETLNYASKVHDVGKIAISDTVLNKPGKLTIAERALIELHPVKGAEMLEPLGFLKAGIPCVRHHHERFDGGGYPDGIKKEQIPIEARIVACADSFDAMTSDRPYRYRKMTMIEAINELELNSGKQFDPYVVPAFVKILKQE
ncbi:MAG: GAF domain-containing protein [Candidatus Omnitrophica bacterium]|nr:GAF domain-containing protein [Candidatus Omnitrophota bacterium]